MIKEEHTCPLGLERVSPVCKGEFPGIYHLMTYRGALLIVTTSGTFLFVNRFHKHNEALV